MTSRFFAPVAAACILAFCCHVTDANKIVLKINLGGAAVADFMGENEVFNLDADGYKKQVVPHAIQQTAQAELFQTQRFARSKDLTIRLPVPDGTYSVTLLMAETYQPACKPGGRVFDILFGTPASGLQLAEPSFDLFANAGCLTAFGKKFDDLPAKEGLIVSLSGIKQHPAIAGIIVEGHPIPKGDGSEYKAIAQMSPPDQFGNGETSIGVPESEAPGSEDASGDDTPYGAPAAASSQGFEALAAPPAPGIPEMGMGGDMGQAPPPPPGQVPPQRRRLLDSKRARKGGHRRSKRSKAARNKSAFNKPGRFSLPAAPF